MRGVFIVNGRLGTVRQKKEARMSISKEDYNRREFIHLGVTTSFALAVCPPMASALTTPADGLITEEVMIPTGEKKMPGYLAMPKGKGPFPTILVVHEIFGVHAYIQDVCRRFAKLGYVATAPYLYFREGDVTNLKEIEDIRSKVVSKVPQAQVMTDIDNTLTWLTKNKKADAKRLAITGFCWGGNVTWMYAAHSKNIKAGVAWYGRLVGDANALNPKFPIDVAGQLNAPVVGLYGGKDKGIPLESIEKMKQALKAGKCGSEFHVYQEAEHGFHADYRPSYNEAAAKDGWDKAVAWFKKNGV